MKFSTDEIKLASDSVSFGAWHISLPTGSLSFENAKSFLSHVLAARQGKIFLSLSEATGFDCNPISDPKNLLPKGFIELQTSGTTGEPKRHSFSAESRIPKLRTRTDFCWGVGYALSKFAAISLILQVLEFEGSLSIPEVFDPADLVSSFNDDRVDAISTTPSVLRLIAMSNLAKLKQIEVKQITLGGEHSSQAIIDLAIDLWPSASVTHVYATTEDGFLFSCSDRLEGFPAEKILSESRFIDENGELFVWGRGTGDFWERRDDRFHFKGRVAEVANIGGFKVWPIEVEKLVAKVPGVDDARVFVVKNSLLGHVLGLEFSGTIEKNELRLALRHLLPKIQIPQLIQKVEIITMGSSGKKARIE